MVVSSENVYWLYNNDFREQYRKRGFHEVITPNMYNAKLWKQSGHWQHYADNMFQSVALIEFIQAIFHMKLYNILSQIYICSCICMIDMKS